MDDALEQFPAVAHTAEQQQHIPFEGADYLINQVIATMRRVRTEGGLLRYLQALHGLHAAALASLRTTTRLSLQVCEGGGLEKEVDRIHPCTCILFSLLWPPPNNTNTGRIV